MTESDDIEFLAEFEDLDRFDQISGRDKITIAQEVQEWTGSTHELVCWLPEWLMGEKDLQPVDGSKQVVSAICDRESSKAWCLKKKPRTEWVPKSVCIAFRRESAFRIPQSGISDFGGGV